jgi:hypothetical protein
VRRPPAAVLLLLLLAAGCGPKTDRDPVAEFEHHRALWNALGITTYELEFQRLCYCPPEFTRPYVVEVENGVIVAVRRGDTGEAVDPGAWDRVHSVDSMFDLLEGALDGGADEVLATYHPEYGYPAEIHIDDILMAVDDEVSYYLNVGSLP